MRPGVTMRIALAFLLLPLAACGLPEGLDTAELVDDKGILVKKNGHWLIVCEDGSTYSCHNEEGVQVDCTHGSLDATCPEGDGVLVWQPSIDEAAPQRCD